MADTQVYCERCRTSSVIQINYDKMDDSGILKRSLVHSDHVLVCHIDSNGDVRKSETIETEFNTMEILIDDVANGFHYMNLDKSVDAILIDFYTSNSQLKQFIQRIIIKMFEQATTKRIEDKYKFVVQTFEDRTILRADKIQVSIGPYIKEDFEGIDFPSKGIILDIIEAEQNKLNIEETLEKYDWAAIMVPRNKKEGYTHALSSLFTEWDMPFFIDVIDNQSLKDLFDFIFAITLTE